MSKKLKVLICGLGSIGVRHLGILRQNFNVDIAVLREQSRGNSLGVPELYRWDEVRRYAPDIAIISNPSYRHMPTALSAVKAGAHIFLEKPISHSMAGIKQLEKACKDHKKICYVAYTLRFVPIVQKAKELLAGHKIFHGHAVCSSNLSQWRPGRNVRSSFSSFRNKGGGVILEVSHEFDLMNYLMGDVSKITGVYGRASDITVDAEDWVDAFMLFTNGSYANVHLNFMSHKHERFFHIDFKDGYLRGDLLSHILVFYYKGKEKNYRMPCERNDYFRDQFKYFIKNLNNPHLMNNLSQAKNLFVKIMSFRRK